MELVLAVAALILCLSSMRRVGLWIVHVQQTRDAFAARHPGYRDDARTLRDFLSASAAFLALLNYIPFLFLLFCKGEPFVQPGGWAFTVFFLGLGGIPWFLVRYELHARGQQVSHMKEQFWIDLGYASLIVVGLFLTVDLRGSPLVMTLGTEVGVITIALLGRWGLYGIVP